MGERSDGTWAAKQIGLSAPRQNGKSQLIVARALAGALLFGERKIVISAHSQDTARETFAKFLEQIDEIARSGGADRQGDERSQPGVHQVQERRVVQFKARTVSGSRGFSSDCLLLDEAQILGMPAWVSINSTMSARPNPQIWLMGTPPTPEDNGEVFTSIRDAAIVEGRSKTLAWLEWSADVSDDPSLDETRAKANPAWHTRINHEVVQGEYETYPPERFALDRLGIWLSDLRVGDAELGQLCDDRDPTEACRARVGDGPRPRVALTGGRVVRGGAAPRIGPPCPGGL
jgi:phage terminase large subunit-like protein